MKRLSAALACLVFAAPCRAQSLAARAIAPAAPGLGPAPAAIGLASAPRAVSFSLSAAPLLAPLPLFAAASADAPRALDAAAAPAAAPAAIPASPAEDDRMGRIAADLREYGQRHGLKGLEGRLQRGLDPSGILAVDETRAKMAIVAERLGASIDEVVAFTNELHVGGIWKNAGALKDATAPRVKAWIIAGGATTDGKPVKDGDLSPAEFRTDLERVHKELDAAVENPEAYFEASRARLIARSKGEFSMQDGVPVSEVGNGFLAMAVSGYRSGIVVDSRGSQPFVGAERLDYERLMKTRGLTRISREDRGRIATFYVDSDGREIVKEVYPGLAIVLTGDMELAREIARAAAERIPKEQRSI